MCSALAGCIVAGPPDYKDPTQTPPVLDLSKADPPIGVVIAVTPGDQVPINVNVRSEDAGDSLVAALYVDFGLATEQLQQAGTRIPPSTFDDTSRSVSFTWTVPNLPPGCRPLTLLVTHRQNFDYFATPNFSDGSDIALATWFLNIDDDGTNTLEQCPKPGATSP